jgi:hypothetical protein
MFRMQSFLSDGPAAGQVSIAVRDHNQKARSTSISRVRNINNAVIYPVFVMKYWSVPKNYRNQGMENSIKISTS